ncbi:GNAT family N-acetyltransferase [Actinoplanes sp. NPDC023801]|uniref:GNAT family N-acetyltransferase n=1 Tax=Actinoplanes sp. NPDC023801 TaxID=3154595 RepID=UPI00340DD271
MTDADDGYVVRRATPADLDAVSEVLAEGRVTAPPATGGEPAVRTERQTTAWAQMMATPAMTVYLAEQNGQPVGTATLLVMPHLTYDCRPSAFLEAVVVRYAHRRRGVAAMLLRHALADARAASCLKVQLLSHKRHAEDGAHRLYLSAGFRPEAEGFRLYLDAWDIPGTDS